MLLEQTHLDLGWPERNEILHPSGAGARVVAELASEKLGRAIARLNGGDGVSVGVLTGSSAYNEVPFAVVCEFTRPVVPEETLLETQRLAWNFSRTLILVTVEPHVVRVWSCRELPAVDRDGHRSAKNVSGDGSGFIFDQGSTNLPEIASIGYVAEENQWANPEAAASIHWSELVSGHFFRAHPERFKEEQKADRMLLSNLKEVRDRLRKSGLADRYSHDLLARIIFVQFLFDRKDSQGHAALNNAALRDLHELRILSAPHETLADVLSNYDDAYALFQELNQRFNGDLFPGNDSDEGEREWTEEQQHVHPEHLQFLAQFVDGRLELESGQINLWRHYAFDAIPLDFISSIYEEFVSGEEGTGIHYTRGHLVDFMLDRVLPWNGNEWDLKVLDPACGSGIFLVKAYQRLVYRWKRAHPEETIRIPVLQKLLEENLFGVDKDANAVRVASFSLYLAMCDEIDPRQYWTHSAVRFPLLRNHRIVCADFFDDEKQGFQTDNDSETYDIVIGNPPWGDSTLSETAAQWANKYEWEVANKDFGTLFLAKAAELARVGAWICMVQSANAVLYNISTRAQRLQERLFVQFRHLESVTNLAQLHLFKNVNMPTCVLTFQNAEPTGATFLYECPKRQDPSEDSLRIVLEPQDVHFVLPDEVINHPWIWNTLMWGGKREHIMIQSLLPLQSLETLNQQKRITTRQGLYKGDEQKELPVQDRRFLNTSSFPEDNFLYLDLNLLPTVNDLRFHSKDTVDLSAFRLPQLLIKTSWIKHIGRFQARMVNNRSTEDSEGVVCSRSYVSVHGDKELLETACLVYNSDFANYFLFLTSARFAFNYTSEPKISILRSIPLPAQLGTTKGIRSEKQLNETVRELYEFNTVENILIDDLIQYTLPDYRGDESPGQEPTNRYASDQRASHLEMYSDVFRRVIQSAYGREKGVQAEALIEEDGKRLPVRVMHFQIGDKTTDVFKPQPLISPKLRQRLATLYSDARRNKRLASSERCLRIYDVVENGANPTLHITLVKPDRIRYWTRSMALRDADAVALDLQMWSEASSSSTRSMEVGVE